MEEEEEEAAAIGGALMGLTNSSKREALLTSEIEDKWEVEGTNTTRATIVASMGVKIIEDAHGATAAIAHGAAAESAAAHGAGVTNAIDHGAEAKTAGISEAKAVISIVAIEADLVLAVGLEVAAENPRENGWIPKQHYDKPQLLTLSKCKKLWRLALVR